MNGGKALRGCRKIGFSQWVAFFRANFEGVQAHRKANIGDKTFLDGLYPAVEAMESVAKNGGGPGRGPGGGRSL